MYAVILHTGQKCVRSHCYHHCHHFERGGTSLPPAHGSCKHLSSWFLGGAPGDAAAHTLWGTGCMLSAVRVSEGGVPPAPALAVLGPAEKPLILEPWATFQVTTCFLGFFSINHLIHTMFEVDWFSFNTSQWMMNVK